MEEQIEKLVNHAGGVGRYQIIVLIIGFFIWSSLSLHNTSIPMLETVPEVKIDAVKDPIKLNYTICEGKYGDYKVTKKFGFSWIIEHEIECDQTKVGLIGSFVNFGLTAGTFTFSLISKYLTHRDIIRIFVILYAFF